MNGEGDVALWDSVWRDHWYSKNALRTRRAGQKAACIRDPILRILTSNQAHVCEIGCGSGHFLKAVSDFLPPQTRFYGCDQSASAIRLARQTTSEVPNVALSVCDAGATPFPSGIFDAVFAVCVLEHVEDKGRVLEEMRRICRIGGYLILFYSSRHSAFRLERVLKSSLRSWKFGYQDELSARQVLELFRSNFSSKGHGTLQGDWDFPLLRSVDFLISLFAADWGRYQYYLLERVS